MSRQKAILSASVGVSAVDMAAGKNGWENGVPGYV